MITNTDFAYAAGYIDGDGCFNVRKEFLYKRISPKYTATLIISSTNKQILIWFQDNFGGSINSPKKTIVGRELHKTVFYYILCQKNAFDLSKKILPYLVEKHEECIRFIEFIETNNKTDKDIFIELIKSFKSSSNLVYKGLKKEFEQHKNTINPNQEDFAYLAGFIDAECCFAIQKYRAKSSPNYVYKIQLRCNNTKSPVFKWLLERFGGNINFIDRKTKNPNHRDQLVWLLGGKSLAKILNSVHPFLKHKKPVCDELIKFYATTLPNGGARHTEKFRTSYAEVIKEREAIVHKVHQLNKKGISHLSG